MPDARFFHNKGPFTLAQVLAWSGATPSHSADPSSLVKDIATLDAAQPGQLSFFHNSRYRAMLESSRASFLLIPESATGWLPSGCLGLIVADPYRAYAAIAARFYEEEAVVSAGIHETAQIDPSAQVHPSASVGPQVTISAHAEIGEAAIIEAGAVIGAGVRIGRGTRIGPNASISFAIIGEAVHILGGATIGQRGFGWALAGAQEPEPEPEPWHLAVPQLGRVLIADRVEFGANSSIDRGTVEDSIIGAGSVIDNSVHLGHNVRIGKGCVIVANSAIAGSASLGDRVTLAGSVSVAGHIHIASDTMVLGCSLVSKSLGPGVYSGIPAEPVAKHRRRQATLSRLVKAEQQRTAPRRAESRKADSAK